MVTYNNVSNGDKNLIDYNIKLLNSPRFLELYNQGISLVEETADYLEGAGKAESRLLSNYDSLNYSRETLRLTTRLMHLASWLMLQRAVANGEMDQERAQKEKARVKIDQQGSELTSQELSSLPIRLIKLMERADKIQNQVQTLEKSLSVKQKDHNINPVKSCMQALNQLFTH